MYILLHSTALRTRQALSVFLKKRTIINTPEADAYGDVKSET
jgi:hypothetical protein